MLWTGTNPNPSMSGRNGKRSLASLLRGMGSVLRHLPLALFPGAYRRPRRKHGRVRDYLAIDRDWKRVGGDLWRAIHQVNEELAASPWKKPAPPAPVSNGTPTKPAGHPKSP